MSDAEAVEVVHQMMDAREREMAKEYDAGAARQRFWKEVAIYPLTLVCALAYTLLMAVAQ